ncbi:MAG: hypothetical protein WDM78_17310 [Puia sp.]
MPLLTKAFQWGRDINPIQPLTAGVWSKSLVDLTYYQLNNSDVIPTTTMKMKRIISWR